MRPPGAGPGPAVDRPALREAGRISSPAFRIGVAVPSATRRSRVEMGKPDQESAAAEEARRATGDAAGRGCGGRLSARRKRETVLRLLRGEDPHLAGTGASVDAGARPPGPAPRGPRARPEGARRHDHHRRPPM